MKNNHLIRLLFAILLLSIPAFFGMEVALAQDAPVLTDVADTLSKEPKNGKHRTPAEHSPMKAALFSAALPGLGQIYNRKYWKLPIVYAGVGGLAYAIGFNARQHGIYRQAYLLRMDGDPETVDKFVDIYRDEDLKTLKDFYRKNLDLSVMFMSLLYAVNIIDAVVDAHLFTFDISDDLSLRLQPEVFSRHYNQSFTGLKICLRL